jgi:ankyrin repeat protein
LFTDNYGHDVYAPDQKVVIGWDGRTETMILSTRVQSADLATFGWVIPIPSKSKPQVELGDVQVFYDLSDYFNPLKNVGEFLALAGGVTRGFDSVQVLETKELGVFDITTLRTTNSNELYRWLRVNAFRVPAAAENILAHYATDDFYFVTVKIDLQNEHKADIESATKYGLLDLVKTAAAKAPTEDQKLVSGALFGQEHTNYLHKHFGVAVAENITFYVLLGRAYPEGLEDYISPQEYEALKAKYTIAAHEFEEVKPSLSRLCEILVQLRAGVAKPLRISFEPSEAFFPLKISSLNGGSVGVTAYVFSKVPVKDEAGILSIEEWKDIDDQFRAKVAKYVTLGNCRCVTKLSFAGPSSQFVNDVHFTRMSDLERSRFSAEGVAEVRSRPSRLVRGIADGDLDAVRNLVALGTKLEDPAGRQLIHLAVDYCYNAKPATKMVEYLLSQGADINARDARFPREQATTPLYRAIEARASAYGASYLEVAEFLLDGGAILGVENLPPRVGTDMLLYAAGEGSERVVELLVSHGVDINYRAWLGQYNRTALERAISAGHVRIAQFLLDHGAPVDNPPDFRNRVYWDQTPLHMACSKGLLELVTFLLDHGAKLENNPECVPATASSGNMALLELLISKGAAIDLPAGRAGKTPLYAAAGAGHKEVVRFLLANGVEPNPKYDRTPLAAAAAAGHGDIVRLLELYGGLPSRPHFLHNLVKADRMNRLTIGMNEAEVMRLLGWREYTVPAASAKDQVLCYLREEDENSLAVYTPVYLIFRNDKLIKWGVQLTLAQYIDECLHKDLGPDVPNAHRAEVR